MVLDTGRALVKTPLSDAVFINHRARLQAIPARPADRRHVAMARVILPGGAIGRLWRRPGLICARDRPRQVAVFMLAQPRQTHEFVDLVERDEQVRSVEHPAAVEHSFRTLSAFCMPLMSLTETS
jgi:hypothetical protein